MSETPWYDLQPARPGPRVRRRDKIELAVALLLLTSLVGLLLVGVGCDRQSRPAPAASSAP